jgi:hypothetical protein
MGPGTQPSKPSTTKPTPTPPATTPNQQASQAKTTCPYLVTKPCDVDTLNVQFEHSYDGPGMKAEPGSLEKKLEFAQTMVRKRGQRASLGGRVQDPALGAYDLVIETIADYNAAETPKSVTHAEPGDLVVLKKVQAGFTSPDCEGDQHPLLTITSKSRADKDLKAPKILHRPKVNNLTIEEDIKLYGAPFMFDMSKAGVGWFVFFEWVVSLFHAAYPKEIEIVAQGCGKREKGATKAINKDLRALLRVHRRDKWSIGLKIPPIGKFSHTRERDGFTVDPRKVFRDADKSETKGSISALGPRGAQGSFETQRDYRSGTTTTTTSSSVRGRVEQTTTTTNTTAGGLRTNSVGTRDIIQDRVYQRSEKDASGNYGYQQSTERINRFGDKEKGKRLVGYKQITEALAKPSSGFEIVFARNDREISSAELGKAIDEIKKNVVSLGSVVAGVQELFKKLPQVGWKFEFDLKALTGFVVVEWAPKNAPCIDARYWPVYTQLKLKLSLEVINLKLALSFGIDLTAGGDNWKTGIVVKIEGTITFKLLLDKELFVDLGPSPKQPEEKGPSKFPVLGDCLAALTPYATAYAAGYTIADARCEVNSGLEFKGEFHMDLRNRDFGLKGELKTKPLIFTASVSGTWWSSPRAIDPKEILPGTSLKKFG